MSAAETWLLGRNPHIGGSLGLRPALERVLSVPFAPEASVSRQGQRVLLVRKRLRYRAPSRRRTMADRISRLTEELQQFLAAQHVFFVATAPLDRGGHVNLSPKGLDTLRVLSPTELAYLDLTGSGNETSAHLLENGRITLMVCAFEGRPRVLRVYGTGRVHVPGSPRWNELRRLFPTVEGVRQIITVAIAEARTSCGYGVPLLEFRGERPTLEKWAVTKGVEGLVRYRREHNARSLDGLPTHLASAED